MAIVVVTHNGEMPCDGGQRLYYLATDNTGRQQMVLLNGQVVPIINLPAKAPEQKKKLPERKTIFYEYLHA